MAFIQIVESVFRFYEGYLFRNHLIDFNDMINKAIELIEKEGIFNNFKYIFLTINNLEYFFLNKIWSKKNKQIQKIIIFD